MKESSSTHQVPAFVIGGHPRSGTTLLGRLCNQHPEISITFEFRAFQRLNLPKERYVRSIRRAPFKRRIINPPNVRSQTLRKAASSVFLAKYLWHIFRADTPLITVDTIADTISKLFPNARIIGDKDPHYVYRLPTLCSVKRLKTVIIYRDGRDVVSSALVRAHQRPHDKQWVGEFGSAELAARSWINAIDAMERYRDRIHTVCYEELLRNPEETLNSLAQFLNVSAEGFRSTGGIRRKNIGKHKKEMSATDTQTVVNIAGPTLQRLGYHS